MDRNQRQRHFHSRIRSVDYNRANLALMLQATHVMSAEAIIAQRFLEEQYCLRSTQCLLGAEPTNPAMAFAVEFSKCLRDEALEKSK
jgi:hypothetical protein